MRKMGVKQRDVDKRKERAVMQNLKMEAMTMVAGTATVMESLEKVSEETKKGGRNVRVAKRSMAQLGARPRNKSVIYV